VEAAVDVFIVVLQRLFVLNYGVLKVLSVRVGRSQVEMAFSTVWVQLEGKLVGMDSLLELASSMVRIPKIVECRIVQWIKSDRLQVILNSLVVVILVAERVTNVVVAFNFLWVQSKSLLVILNCFIDIL